MEMKYSSEGGHRKASRTRAAVKVWKELYGHIRGELWKLRHTLLPWLHVLIPLLGIAVFLAYYSFAAWSDAGKVSGYIETLTIALPLVVSVICSISAELEESGHYQTFLGVSVYKRNPLLAKWIVLSGMGLLSIFAAVLGFALGYWVMKGSMVLLMREYLILILVMWFCSVSLYLIHLFLNFAFSKNISLCAGTAELVIAALFLTGLGDGRWQFVPCSWAGRWTEYLIQYWTGNKVLPAEAVMKNLGSEAAVTVILWIVFFMWFYFYEGRQCRD